MGEVGQFVQIDPIIHIGLIKQEVIKMTTGFFIALACILVFDGVVMAFFAWAVQAPRFARYRIRTPDRQRISTVRKAVNIGLNGVLALSFFTFVFTYFGGSLIVDQHLSVAVPGVLVFGEVLAYEGHPREQHSRPRQPVPILHGSREVQRQPQASELGSDR